MTKFLREDVKELKVCELTAGLIIQNQKQEFLRIQERYEDLLSRYASQSKSKEPSSIRDVIPHAISAHCRRRISYTLPA